MTELNPAILDSPTIPKNMHLSERSNQLDFRYSWFKVKYLIAVLVTPLFGYFMVRSDYISGNFQELDFEAQCHSVFQNVRRVLEDAGASWDSLVDVTVFLVDMKRDFHTYNRVYAEYFKDNQPCRTTVGIDSLPTPIAIELKCVAYVGS